MQQKYWNITYVKKTLMTILINKQGIDQKNVVHNDVNT